MGGADTVFLGEVKSKIESVVGKHEGHKVYLKGKTEVSSNLLFVIKELSSAEEVIQKIEQAVGLKAEIKNKFMNFKI